MDPLNVPPDGVLEAVDIPPRLGPIAVPKASDVLARELRERILSGQFTEGAALPSERDLVSQTRMSRATVREALRMLEVQGLLEVRAGRGGGAFVRQPGSDAVANSVELFVRGRQVRLSALLETREAIEPTCAELAADRRTDDDLARLEAANQAIEAVRNDLPAFLSANVHWHLVVAETSHNELLSAFMHSISRILYTSTENEEFVDADVRSTAIRAHHAVTNAIRDGDPAAARRRMERHVHSYATAVLQVEKRREIELTDGAGDGPPRGRRVAARRRARSS
ncbi:MAG: FadR/GntR family transcriptional regulator [Ilumatobacteraceae bacterium]